MVKEKSKRKAETQITDYPDVRQISSLLNQKEYSAKYITGVTRRLISHWQVEGLLSDERNEEQTWRKFSLIDILWMGIIGELRELGLSNSKIKNVRSHLFNDESLANKQSLPLLEYCTMETITYAAPTFIIVDKEGSTEVVNDIDYVEQLKAGKIGHHIIISLNQAVDDNIRPLYTKPTYSDLTGLSKDELEVLAVVRSNDFQSIKITKKNGEIDMIEGVERIKSESRIIDLLKEGKYQNIEVKQENGKVVCINRTLRKKLK